MNKVLSFAPNGLTRIYLKRIAVDLKTDKPSQLLNKIVSGYFIMQYGEAERNQARNEYTEQLFKDQ